MNLRLVSVTAPVLAVIALLGVPVSPAQADHWPLCSSGNFCIYKNEFGHDGGVWPFSGSDSNYSGNTFERCFVNCDANDATSSLWNRESFTVRAFVNASHCGPNFNTSAGVKRNTMPSGFNDAISSHGPTSSTC